ncbi:MAG: hypothetical protein N4A45_01035 [Flavobacteriales bacterium]|jgi:predicted nucleotidyltransferase|nr:hypothetical protein [Flavobacteriales bacterium]
MSKGKEEKKPVEESKAPISNDQKIDVIKELIFGNNMREYQQEFEDVNVKIKEAEQRLSDQLNQSKEELYDYIEEMRKEFNNKIDELQMNLNQEVDRLDDQKMDRQLLADQLEKMARKIKE